MHEEKFVIGLDLGGTNSVFGITDKNGNIKSRISVKTQKHDDIYLYIDECSNALNKIIEECGGIRNIKAMGIGAPNANYYTGMIENAVNLPWKGFIPLANMFSKRLGIPVCMTNDANAAALGEMYYGAAKGMKNFIMITLGTGVGSGIVINGEIVYGSDGFAGELGHVIVDRSKKARKCGCGRYGCLETYCSATGIVKTACEMINQYKKDSVLKNIKTEDITAKAIGLAAEKGDSLALDIFNYTGNIMGMACADFTTFCSPEAFIFFGGVTKAGQLIMGPIEEAYNKNVMSTYKGKTKFLISELKDADAAILGAAALAWYL